MTEEILQLNDLRPDPRVGFNVMRDAMRALFGEQYLARVLQVNREGMAKRGVIGWVPNDGNIVIDVCPMREPWGGQWGYRLRLCGWDGTGDIVINEFQVPYSSLPAFRNGDTSSIQ